MIHGATATDPVANESDCCFGCDYHNCMIAMCEVCEETMVWDWRNLDPPKWAHIDRPADGHDFQWEPPEHWAWILENRVSVLPTEPIPQGKHVGELHGWSLWTGVTCVECPSCAFTFDASHTNRDGTSYSCPLCDDGLYEAEQFDGSRDAGR